MNKKDVDYTPALKFRWLTPLYEPLTNLWWQEKKFKEQLIKQTDLQPYQKVLDVGCGPGKLLRMVKNTQPTVEAFGVDIDSDMLSIAKKKAAKKEIVIFFEQASSTQIPFRDQTFTHLYSSLLFHHLTMEDKQRTLEEMYRILHHKGQAHILDFGKATNIFMKAANLPIQLWDGFETARPHEKGKLVELFKTVFKSVQLTNRFNTPLGTMYTYRLTKI